MFRPETISSSLFRTRSSGIQAVLATTVKLMSKPDKKVSERFWMDRLREASGLAFELADCRENKEQPDFLLRYEGRSIGLEVTELQTDQVRYRRGGSGLRRETALRRLVVAQAQDRYFAAPASNINVKAYFRPGAAQSLARFDHHELAESISGALRAVTLDPFERIRLDRYSNPAVAMPIGFVDALGIPQEIKARWLAIEPGSSRELEPSDLGPILESKNSRLPEYTKTVSVNWLLIVADGSTPSGMFRLPADGMPELPASNFDRTFLLCEPDRFLYEWPRAVDDEPIRE